MYTGKFLEQLLAYSDHSQQLAFRAGYELHLSETSGINNVQSPTPAPLPTIEPAQGLLNLQPAPSRTREYREGSKCRGLRADILRLLYSGPANFNHLLAVLKLEARHVKNSLSSLVRSGLMTTRPGASPSSPTQYILTDKGMAEARFFLEHPSFKVYRPDTKN